MSQSSYHTILRSSSIIGGAQVINVAANLVKMKCLALLLGPLGVGAVGLYVSLIQTGSTIASLGLGTAGTRQIAAANAEGENDAVDTARRTLFWATLTLALIGAAIFWLGRFWIAELALADRSRGDEMGWLAIGVALTVAAGSQSALLTGLRRIGDLARVQVASGAAGALLGVLAIVQFGVDGIILMVLIAPLVAFLVGHLYVARLPKVSRKRASFRELSAQLRTMAGLGLAFMMSALAAVFSQLVVRVLVQRELGGEPLGHFQAAWAISVTYLGFVLGAMGTDYFPRLSAVINDPQTATRLVNEQTEVALLLSGPVIIGLIGAAPYAITILYSSEFAPAIDVLRWQLLGDILKVMSWPLGFVLLAASAGRLFLVAEAIGVATLLAGVAIGLPVIGIEATGIAFVAMYLAYLPLVYWLCVRRIGFRWTKAVMVQAASVVGLAVIVILVAGWSELAGALTGVLAAAVLGFWAIIRVSEVMQPSGRLAILARIGERVRTWMIKRT